MWLVATILGQHRFGEQGGYWWAWSLKAYFPFLFSKAVTEISSMVRENDFPVSLWPPITSQEAGFAYLDRSSALCLGRSKRCRETGKPKAASSVRSAFWEKGRRQKEMRHLSFVTSSRVISYVDGLRGVLGVEERRLLHWLPTPFAPVLRHWPGSG